MTYVCSSHPSVFAYSLSFFSLALGIVAMVLKLPLSIPRPFELLDLLLLGCLFSCPWRSSMTTCHWVSCLCLFFSLSISSRSRCMQLHLFLGTETCIWRCYTLGYSNILPTSPQANSSCSQLSCISPRTALPCFASQAPSPSRPRLIRFQNSSPYLRPRFTAFLSTQPLLLLPH